MAVPVEVEQTKAEQFISQMGWSSRPSGSDNIAVQVCPLCENTNYKFFIHSGGEKDGLWDCKVCGEKGNLFQLKDRLGIRTQNVQSIHDAAAAKAGPGPLPDFKALHWRLLNDTSMADVLDYLVAERKFSMEVIERLKIGAEDFGDRKWFVIPYFDAAGNGVYYKARTVPPAKKDFRSPSGREAPLFNGTILTPGMEELVIVEGEADTISLLSQGYETVVGVPGASMKKASWIEKLDAIAPKQIYLLYDRDKVGQGAAREMAIRIGLDKVKNILLPEFGGKDINEWFAAGHTLEEFNALKGQAKAFDVAGVQSVLEVLEEFKAELLDKGIEPTYKSPWGPLNDRLGGMEDGDLVGIIAEGKVGKTTLALNWLEWFAEHGINSFMYCDEMKPKRMVRKWVSHITQTDDTPGKSKITPEIVDTAVHIGGNLPGDLLFGYTGGHGGPQAVFDTIRQVVRRYGVKIVCYDNLQLLVRSVEHSAQETSKLTKQFKALAMELNIVILLIIQPNRVAEGQIVAARNAMGSSAIEKDVDAMICMHRNRVACIKQADFKGIMETEDNFEPHTLIRVDLSRYSAGGACTLWMDGSTSTVRELTSDDLTTPSTTALGGIPTEAVAV